jgi:hypothetical protein
MSKPVLHYLDVYPEHTADCYDSDESWILCMGDSDFGNRLTTRSELNVTCKKCLKYLKRRCHRDTDAL